MGKLADYLKHTGAQQVLLPRLKKFLKDEARLIKAGKLKNHVPVQEDAQLTIECFQERLESYNHGDANPYKGYVHPSQIAACLRQQWYASLDAPVNGEPLGDELLTSHLIFETGTYCHVMFQNLCERAGFLRQREFPIVDHDLRIVGHGDGILDIDGEPYMLEIKTINARGFAELREPKADHKLQVTAYMHVGKLPATIFIYLEKDRHNVKEYVFRYNAQFWRDTVLPRIERIKKAHRSPDAPEREGRAPHVFPCSYCAYSRICYNEQAHDQWLANHAKPLKNENKAASKEKRGLRKIRRRVVVREAT